MFDEDKLVKIFENVTSYESRLYLLSFGYLFDNFEFLKEEADDFMDKVNPEMLKAIEEYIPSIIDSEEEIADYMLTVRFVLKQ